MSGKKKLKDQGSTKLKSRNQRSKLSGSKKSNINPADNSLRHSEDQLRNLSAHLQTLRERERSRLSREINEELGQILSILKFDLNWIEENLNENQNAVRERVQSMSKLIAAVIEWVRRISQELRPSLLDTLGLVPAIEWELNEFKKRTGISCEFRSHQAEITLGENISTVIFRILQEILSNIFMHAQAKSVKVSLDIRKKRLILSVGDEGAVIPDGKRLDNRSIGLFSIQERVRFLNGKINIVVEENKGVNVTVELPYKQDGLKYD
ncbi:MAG: hypothetical protein JSW33_03015 [bacterium]|nr:MAG: hypothetical protein JSW33_03015 [bacterium]